MKIFFLIFSPIFANSESCETVVGYGKIREKDGKYILKCDDGYAPNYPKFLVCEYYRIYILTRVFR